MVGFEPRIAGAIVSHSANCATTNAFHQQLIFQLGYFDACIFSGKLPCSSNRFNKKPSLLSNLG